MVFICITIVDSLWFVILFCLVCLCFGGGLVAWALVGWLFDLFVVVRFWFSLDVCCYGVLFVCISF